VNAELLLQMQESFTAISQLAGQVRCRHSAVFTNRLLVVHVVEACDFMHRHWHHSRKSATIFSLSALNADLVLAAIAKQAITTAF
jgi:hypothetical protein